MNRQPEIRKTGGHQHSEQWSASDGKLTPNNHAKSKSLNAPPICTVGLTLAIRPGRFGGTATRIVTTTLQFYAISSADV